MSLKNLSSDQIENIVLDDGVVYIDYGLGTERLLAPTRGGNSFVVEQEVRNIERDGARGKEKGLRRVINEDAMLTVNLMDLSLDNIALALAGARTTDDGTNITSIKNGYTGLIADADYITNVTLIAPTLGGQWKVITIYNALSDNGLSMELTDKDESVVELQLSAHWDPADLTAEIYKIEDANPTDTYDITFTVTSDGSAAVADAIVYLDGSTKLTNSSGVAVFKGYADGDYPYTVAKSGNVTASDTATVSGTDLDVPVTIAPV